MLTVLGLSYSCCCICCYGGNSLWPEVLQSWSHWATRKYCFLFGMHIFLLCFLINARLPRFYWFLWRSSKRIYTWTFIYLCLAIRFLLIWMTTWRTETMTNTRTAIPTDTPIIRPYWEFLLTAEKISLQRASISMWQQRHAWMSAMRIETGLQWEGSECSSLPGSWDLKHLGQHASVSYSHYTTS